jgi:hypothetical protein
MEAAMLKINFPWRYLWALVLLLPLNGIAQTVAGSSAELYPHWNPSDPAIPALEKFIGRYKDQGLVAVFDWDGTLYSERIKVREGDQTVIKAGQPAWHIWGADHLREDPTLFPMFRTYEKPEEWKRNIYRFDDYIEGLTNVQVSGYSKFSQIAMFEAGMTPHSMTKALEKFFVEYDPCKFAIYPAFDVAQRLVDSGFHLWVVTGTNPYYVAALLRVFEGRCRIAPGKPYRLHLAGRIYNPEKDRIVGNASELSKEGKFTISYDDRFVRGSDDRKLYAIEGEGKEVAIRNWIEPREGKEVVFAAGNSGNDSYMVRYVTGKSGKDVFVLGVNPRGELEKMLTEKHPRAAVATVHVEEVSE